MRWREYYRLTKPGIIYGNILTAAAGFLFASQTTIDSGLFLATILGTSLIIAGAGAFNNLMDRRLDAVMKRTANRPLVTGTISPVNALVFASVVTIAGFTILATQTNWLVVLIGGVGLVDYLFAYGWTKRHSSLSTLVGSISGATPIAAGYVAAQGHFDTAAWLLFGLMVVWQMPHFYAIALFRAKDYRAIKLPLMPLQQSFMITAWRLRAYIAAFGLLVILFAVFGNGGLSFAVIMLTLTALWLYNSRGHPELEAGQITWGRRLFGYSLYVVLGLSLSLMTAAWLP